MNNKKNILDSWLVLESQLGNKKAFGLLVKRWHPKLCKQAYWYTRDTASAQDIAQDSWTVIFRKIQQIKDVNSFGSWALRIVTRKALDALRKSKSEQKHLDQYYTAKDTQTIDVLDVAAEDPMVILKRAIKVLPVRQQEILHLFYLEEFSIHQISEILNVSKGTIKSRLFTAREKLKTIVKK